MQLCDVNDQIFQQTAINHEYHRNTFLFENMIVKPLSERDYPLDGPYVEAKTSQ